MVRLVTSNLTEQLLAVLTENVRAQQANDGPLVPVRIVVPGAMLDRYVRLGIARTCGIAANLETMLLTRFAAQAVSDRAGARVATADELEAMALTLLLDDAFLQGSELAPVRAYLRSVDSSVAVDARRVQLAARIGRLFEEYTYSRDEMLASWAGGTTLGPRYAESERWQRRLWLAMFGDGGLARDRGVVPLHEGVARLAESGRPPGAGVAAVHLFAFAHFAPTFHRLLAHLGRAGAGDVTVYTLSPCEGFWEDVDPRDPPPVHLWGRPGREQVRALNAAAGFDHDERFVEPRQASLLAQLQRDLLHRTPARSTIAPQFSFARDPSVRVLEHASVRREIEAIASEIWELVVHDETMRFDEIGVLLPDAQAEAYLAHLPAAFAEAHDIPHQIVGVPVPGGSRVAEAALLLLALPLGRFTRQELLRLAVHPAVVASLQDVDPHRWLQWCDALGVVHGADRADHADTYIERDLYNWDQGLRRLALGAFMAGDASGCRTPVEIGAEAYVPYEVAPSELRDAATFSLLIRSLVADARFARDAVLTMPEWARLLGAFVETYVASPTEADADALARCLRSVHSLAQHDLQGKRVPYGVAAELARSRISGLSSARGGTGVVVSTLTAMRAVPLRAVFACGLGEGCFPSSDAEDSLDLRAARRQPGDVTARERDKYAFLELLLAAGERLCLSHVSRDPLTGDALAPSSVVQELLHALDRGYVRASDLARVRHPLRRWDPGYFPDLFPRRGTPQGDGPTLATPHLPEAHAEARTLAIRRSLEAKAARPTLERVQELAEGNPAWSLVADALGLLRVPPSEPVPDERVVIPIYALVKFLEFPLQGWARFRVGLDEAEDEDVLARESEPFETDLRDETLLLREVLLAAREDHSSLEQAYDAVVRERELRGEGPSGIFARGERDDHLNTLESWRSELRNAKISLDQIEIHRFGRAGEHARADRVHESLSLDVAVVDPRGVQRTVRAEIVGRALPLATDAGASLTLLRRAKEKRDDPWARAGRDRTALRAFVDHAMLTAKGVATEGSHSSVLVLASGTEAATERTEFAPLSSDEATAWLRGLVRELLGGPHAYFFPCEAVFVWQRGDPAALLLPKLAEARDRLRDRTGPMPLRSAYGPVPRPHEYPLPTEADARSMVARRFDALFAKRKETP
jgi:exodeoxyribonuclease V gamma subunit